MRIVNTLQAAHRTSVKSVVKFGARAKKNHSGRAETRGNWMIMKGKNRGLRWIRGARDHHTVSPHQQKHPPLGSLERDEY